VIIPSILICERRLGDPRITFIPTQSIYERAPAEACAELIHSNLIASQVKDIKNNSAIFVNENQKIM
jgi:hypothetical protein